MPGERDLVLLQFRLQGRFVAICRLHLDGHLLDLFVRNRGGISAVARGNGLGGAYDLVGLFQLALYPPECAPPFIWALSAVSEERWEVRLDVRTSSEPGGVSLDEVADALQQCLQVRLVLGKDGHVHRCRLRAALRCVRAGRGLRPSARVLKWGRSGAGAANTAARAQQVGM